SAAPSPRSNSPTARRFHFTNSRNKFRPCFSVLYGQEEQTPMDGRLDNGYALLFSQPRMVRDLLRGFLPEEWIGWLDPGTLERRGGGSHPDRPGRPPIWRPRLQGGP